MNLPLVTDQRHKWIVWETTYDSYPLIVRTNVSAREWFGSPLLPIKLGFAFPLKTSLNTSRLAQLPLPEEHEELNTIEDTVRQHVELNTNGVHALALTNAKMRELIFYVSADVDIKAIHEAVRKDVSAYDTQCMAVLERDWITYENFCP